MQMPCYCLKKFDGGPVFFKHFSALLVKRFIYGKRDVRMLFCQVILPVLLVVLGLGLLQLRPGFNQVRQQHHVSQHSVIVFNINS